MSILTPLPDDHRFDHPDQLLTLDVAAKRLSVSRRTLYRMIAAGEFPEPLHVGGARRVPVSDLNAYLAQLKKRRA